MHHKLAKLTAARVAEILRRQRAPVFGKGYEPSIKACREEAPSSSRFATVWSSLLGRDIHTLSRPERAVLGILLYCPSSLFELQEQRMLPFVPAAHPLEGHPFAEGVELKMFRGTLAVAAELNCLPFHPVASEVKGGLKRDIPGCWIGDYLAFLKDAKGPFCVNFNVKETRDEFTVPAHGVSVKTNLARARAKNTARHRVEKQVYADIDIPTIEVAADEIPEILVANLELLLLWQKRGHGLTREQVQVVLDAFNDGLAVEASPLEVMAAVEVSHQINPYQQKTVLYQGIYRRALRIDLFESHLFIDKPMVPERRDVVEVFGDWFRRAA